MAKKVKKTVRRDPWIRIHAHALIVKYLIDTSNGPAVIKYVRLNNVERDIGKYEVLVKAYLSRQKTATKTYYVNSHPTQRNALKLLTQFYAEAYNQI